MAAREDRAPLPRNGKPKGEPRARGATPTPPLAPPPVPRLVPAPQPKRAPKASKPSKPPQPGKTPQRSREETPQWARGSTATIGADAERPKARATTVRSALAIRRAIRAATGPVFGIGLAAGLAWVQGRRLAPGVDTPLLALALVLVAYGGRLITRLVSRVRAAALPRDPGTPTPGVDFELSLLMSSGAVAVATYLPGGLDGAGYAGVYAACAVGATFATRTTAWLVAACTIAVEIGIRMVARDPELLRGTSVHALVIAIFVALNAIVLRGRIDAIGVRARLRLQREVERMREQARSYRLHDTPEAGAKGDKPRAEATGPIAALTRGATFDRVQRSGVEEIQIAVRFALDLLKRSLGAHSAILLFESSTAGALKVCEVVSDAKSVAEGPFGMGDGVLGAVVRRKAPVSLHGLRAGYRVPYYPAPLGEGDVTSLVAVPILEGGVVRGVLCVDRLPVPIEGATHAPGEAPPSVDRPFSAHEEELVSAAARYILRAIENERVFGRLERAKAEQDHLYAASQRLSGALTEAEVLEAGVESARAIAAFDLAAITIVHDDTAGGGRTHEVRAVAGAADFESLVGLRFGDNGGLVAQAVKARHSLPHRGDHDPATQVVFTRRHPLRVELVQPEAETEDDDGTMRSAGSAEVRSILVVPLTLRERALGTLVLGARRRGAFRDFSGASGGGARTTLEVLASHIAASLANARMFAKLEELATTDGLTGLLNKRVLLELGAQKVRAAVRYGKPMAVIQTDIDHFKRVNDTYGHDVGDQVIRGLAGILRRLKRGTDYVARFGGEEFVIICEETDAPGAIHLAERVREELERTTFHAVHNGATVNFQVTCSLGVATFPQDGDTWDILYKATDDALYASKRAGRNRTTVATHLRMLPAATSAATG